LGARLRFGHRQNVVLYSGAVSALYWLAQFAPREAHVPKVEIYTTNYCPFCVRAKSLLKKKRIQFEEIDVTDNEELRDKMTELAGGRRSVPEIFINGLIVGGYEELRALDDAGDLDRMLAESA